MDYQLALEKILAHQKSALQPHTLDNDQTVWVRKVNKGNLFILYSLQRFVTMYLHHIPVLQPVYTNPRKAIEEEANRLTQLEKSGINVPHLIAANNDGFMMSALPILNNGFNLAEKFDAIQKQGNSTLPLWKKSVDILFELHSKEQYLSQAFMRNIMYLGSDSPTAIAEIQTDTEAATAEKSEVYLTSSLSDWAFFDFEEDPGKTLTTSECQTRDYFFFINSSSHYVADQATEAVSFWCEQISKTNNQEAFLSTIASIRKMRHLGFMRDWGRDFRRFFSSIDFLLACEKNLKSALS